MATIAMPRSTTFLERQAELAAQADAAITNAWIREQLARGNEWAWCVATVTAEYDGCIGRASLGGCSYESHKAFDDAGETAQLATEALDDLTRRPSASPTTSSPK